MIDIKYKDNLYKFPANIIDSKDLLEHFRTKFPFYPQELIISFNNIFLSTELNYNLLEIGYSLRESLEIHDLMIKKNFFCIFNYSFQLEINQFTNVFTIKQHFSNFFYTVPQNINVIYKNKKLADTDNLYDTKTSHGTPIQITVTEEHILVRTYLNNFHFVCMPLESTMKDLEETISIYSQKVDTKSPKTNIYDKKLHNKKFLESKEMNDSEQLLSIALSTPLFEFCESNSQNCEPYTIFVTIKDDDFDKKIVKNYQFSYKTSIYSIMVLLEKDFKIERSLFVPFDKDGNKMSLNEVISSDRPNVLFKIFYREYQPFHLRYKEKDHSFSFLTTIKEIQQELSFEKHNFGIIINNHFACDDSKFNFLLIHFINPCKQCELSSQIIIKKSKDPCIQFASIKKKKNECLMRQFIIPKNLHHDYIANNYLHQNFNSITVLDSKDNVVLYKNSEKQIIEYTLFDISLKDHHHSVEIKCEKPRIYDLIYAIYEKENKLSFFFKKCDNVKPTFMKRKLYFWELLSRIPIDKDNKIHIFEEKINDDSKLIYNFISGEPRILFLSYKNMTAEKIIKKCCKDHYISESNLGLYSDFNELRPTDIPSIYEPINYFLILNKKTNIKLLKINNCNNLQFGIAIKNAEYSNLAKYISNIFMIPENELKFSTSINGTTINLPSKFDAGAFLNKAEIYVQYDYKKNNYIFFEYEDVKKLTEIDIENPIESHIQKVLNSFKIWEYSKKLIYFSFNSFIFPSNKSFYYYRIPENAAVLVNIKKQSIPIQISKFGKLKFNTFYFSEGEKISDVINHFKTKYHRELTICEDIEGKKIVDSNKTVDKDMKLYLISKKTKLQREGSLGNEKIEVSEILKVKNAVKMLNIILESGVYLFTKKTYGYEPVDENKRLYEFNTKLYVHKYYSQIDFGYNIFAKEDDISELNTINWLKEKFISKIFFLNTCDIAIEKDEKIINDSIEIKNIIYDFNEKLHIKFEINTKKPTNKPIKRIKKFRPIIKPVDEDSDDLSIPIKKQNTDSKKIECNDHIENIEEQIISKLTSQKIDGESDTKEDTINGKICFLSASFLMKLQNKRIIGRGATSTVYKVYLDKYPNQKLALKVINLNYEIINDYDDDYDNDDNYERFKIDKDFFTKNNKFFKEYEILNNLNHPNIIKVYGFYKGDEKNAPSILLEYCRYNLATFLKKMSKGDKIEKIFELCSAMKEIHKKGIIHRDLKPENILITEDKILKVCDFGICTLIENSNTSSRTAFIGTMIVMAPEIKDGSAHYDEKVDVYSFGVVVYYILNNGNYPSFSIKDLAYKKKLEFPETISQFAQELIQRCCSYDAKDRPSFSEIYELLMAKKQELIK